VAETTVGKLTRCGFRRNDKAIGQMYQYWLRICREINIFFQFRISHVLRFISVCDLFTDTSSYYLVIFLVGSRQTGKLEPGTSLYEIGMLTILPVNSILCVLIYAVHIHRSIHADRKYSHLNTVRYMGDAELREESLVE
jgi:hypothetical protein